MWMILGLLSAILAGSAAEAIVNKAFEDEEEESDPAEDGSNGAAEGLRASGYPDEEPAAQVAGAGEDDSHDPVPSLAHFAAQPLDDVTDPDIDVVGLFDMLDERIHSSDTAFHEGQADMQPTAQPVASDTPPDATVPGTLPPPQPAPQSLLDADSHAYGDDVPGRFDMLGERIHSSDAALALGPTGSGPDSDDTAPGETLPGAVSPPTTVLPPHDGMYDTGRGDDVPGQFDMLGERIHSNDADPEPEPAQGQRIEATGPDDTLRAGVGNDTLVGGAGGNLLSAGAGGNNMLHGGGGDDRLIGGAGDDALFGGDGNDTLQGGAGNDLLLAGTGDNALFGGSGNDILVGFAPDADGSDQGGRSFLNGGAGQDILIIGQGDYAHGGEDADLFVLGDWLGDGPSATIMDYDPAKDRIVLHYDPADGPPAIAVTHADDSPATAQVWIDGALAAEVLRAPGLTAEEITLIAGYPETAMPSQVA